MVQVEVDADLNGPLNRLAILQCRLESPALNRFYCLCVEVFVRRRHNPNVMRHTINADHQSYRHVPLLLGQTC